MTNVVDFSASLMAAKQIQPKEAAGMSICHRTLAMGGRGVSQQWEGDKLIMLHDVWFCRR